MFLFYELPKFFFEGVVLWADGFSVKGRNGKILFSDSRSCNDGSLERFLVFHNPQRKFPPSASAVATILKCLVGVPFQAASSKKEEKQVWSNYQKAREYIEGGNQVSSKSSPLEGMKAQPL